MYTCVAFLSTSIMLRSATWLLTTSDSTSPASSVSKLKFKAPAAAGSPSLSALVPAAREEKEICSLLAVISTCE